MFLRFDRSLVYLLAAAAVTFAVAVAALRGVIGGLELRLADVIVAALLASLVVIVGYDRDARRRRLFDRSLRDLVRGFNALVDAHPGPDDMEQFALWRERLLERGFAIREELARFKVRDKQRMDVTKAYVELWDAVIVQVREGTSEDRRLALAELKGHVEAKQTALEGARHPLFLRS